MSAVHILRLSRDPLVAILCNALRHAHSAILFGADADASAKVLATIELALAPFVPPDQPTTEVLPQEVSP